MRTLKVIDMAVALVLGLLVTAGRLAALEMPETPVQSAMQAAIWSARAGQSASVDGDSWPGSASAPTVLDNSEEVGRKSLFKAVTYSFLIPGGGQYYVGNKRTAHYFFAAEALTWIGFASFTVYSHWKKDDYLLYASVHANAQLEGKSDDFVDLVGFYDDIDEYNTLARAFDPDRPYLRDTPENHWSWESDAARLQFRSLKNSSREASRRANFMIGVAVVDRIVSMIDAARATRKHNRQMRSEFSKGPSVQYKFSVHPLSESRQVSLTVYPGF